MMMGMNLHDYLAGNSNAGLAAALGVPAPLVSQWRTRTRPVPLERCSAIERATDGAVRRWDLRPNDWWEIWPELIGADGAPAVPAAERVA